MTMVTKYRKKPVIVEAIKFKYSNDCIKDILEFAKGNIGQIYKARHIDARAELEIVTLEDGNLLKAKHIATEGDYIVKGVEGEFYAIKPNIFESTYDRVEVDEHGRVIE